MGDARREAAADRPSNLHVSECALGLVRLQERMERKFFVVPSKAGAALAFLRRTCRYDREFPEEQITSLYFDTHDLEEHQRSTSGEFGKSKVRIRWYGKDAELHGPSVRVWLELKSRQGFASTKQRMILDVPAESLAPRVLREGIVPVSTLTQTMAGFGFFAKDRLHPVVAISYWRHRFVEPRSGYRVSLDSRIRSSMVMPGKGCGERGLELPGAVVEVKGPSYDTPRALRGLADFGTSWTRYSKYSSSLDAHAADMGAYPDCGPRAPWSSVREPRSTWEYPRAGGKRPCRTWPWKQHSAQSSTEI